MHWLSSNQSLVFDLPATYEKLHLLETGLQTFLQQHNLQQDCQFQHDVLLATHEICTNIIDHAYAGNPEGRISVNFSLCASLSLLQIELRDNGRSFDPATVTPPELSVPQERGYGLFLTELLMDNVNYIHHNGQNIWQLIKLFGLSSSPCPPTTHS